jgi:hypothetical protein
MYGTNIRTLSARPLSNREIRRRAHGAIEEGTRAFFTCLAVLAQKGGEVIVTQETLNQVSRNLKHMDFTVEPNKDVPGEFVVKIV